MWIWKPSFLRITKNHALKCCQKSLNRDPNAFLWRLPLTFELWPTLQLLPLLQEGGITLATHKYVSPFYFSITLQKEKWEVPQDSDRSIKKHTLKLAIINLTQIASAAIPYDRAHLNNTCPQVRVLCAAFGIHQSELLPSKMYAHDMTKNTRKVKRRGKNRKQQQMSLSQ